MKRLIAILALSTAFGVAACDQPTNHDMDVNEMPMDAPLAPAAEDVGEPVVAAEVPAPPVDSTTLPPEKRSSSESVRPESETLFY